MSIIIFTSLDYFMEVCEIEIALKIFPLRAYFLQISAIHEISRIAEILPNAEIQRNCKILWATLGVPLTADTQPEDLLLLPQPTRAVRSAGTSRGSALIHESTFSTISRSSVKVRKGNLSQHPLKGQQREMFFWPIQSCLRNSLILAVNSPRYVQFYVDRRILRIRQNIFGILNVYILYA